MRYFCQLKLKNMNATVQGTGETLLGMVRTILGTAFKDDYMKTKIGTKNRQDHQRNQGLIK